MKRLRVILVLAFAAGTVRFIAPTFRAKPATVSAAIVAEKPAPRVGDPPADGRVVPGVRGAAVSSGSSPAREEFDRAAAFGRIDGQPEQGSPALAALPLAELEHLQRIATDYRELSDDIYARSSGLVASADRARLDFLQKEESADLSVVLAPAAVDDLQRPAPGTPWPRRR